MFALKKKSNATSEVGQRALEFRESLSQPAQCRGDCHVPHGARTIGTQRRAEGQLSQIQAEVQPQCTAQPVR